MHTLGDPILLRHLPILGYPVSIRMRPKRFRCPDCDNHPTTTQRLRWYAPRALHTLPYQRHLLMQVINRTVEDVMHKQDVSQGRHSVASLHCCVYRRTATSLRPQGFGRMLPLDGEHPAPVKSELAVLQVNLDHITRLEHPPQQLA